MERLSAEVSGGPPLFFCGTSLFLMLLLCRSAGTDRIFLDFCQKTPRTPAVLLVAIFFPPSGSAQQMFSVLSSRRYYGEIPGAHALLASHPLFGSFGYHQHSHRPRGTGKYCFVSWFCFNNMSPRKNDATECVHEEHCSFIPRNVIRLVSAALFLIVGYFTITS